MAQFHGLRYFMFNWPFLAAVIIITTNLILVLMVLLLTWYHCSDATWVTDARIKYAELRSRERRNTSSLNVSEATEERTPTRGRSSSSLMVDDEDLTVTDDAANIETVMTHEETGLRQKSAVDSTDA